MAERPYIPGALCKTDDELRELSTPWTVSVATMPGAEPCPELQRLDLALYKRRIWREEDELVEAWKARIEWPLRKGYSQVCFNGRPIRVPKEALEEAKYGMPAIEWLQRKAYADWMDWLTKVTNALFLPTAEDIEAGRIVPDAKPPKCPPLPPSDVEAVAKEMIKTIPIKPQDETDELREALEAGQRVGFGQKAGKSVRFNLDGKGIGYAPALAGEVQREPVKTVELRPEELPMLPKIRVVIDPDMPRGQVRIEQGNIGKREDKD